MGACGAGRCVEAGWRPIPALASRVAPCPRAPASAPAFAVALRLGAGGTAAALGAAEARLEPPGVPIGGGATATDAGGAGVATGVGAMRANAVRRTG